jgi:ABC-type phosphate transport system substrate-binding protein
VKSARFTRLLKTLVAVVAIGLTFRAIGADVVVVVSPNSPVTALSIEQIADIFLGRSNRFPDGTVALPIDQEDGSPERTDFVSRYIGQTPVQVKMHWSKLIFTGRGQPPRQVSDSREVKEVLAQNPNAIGYIDRNLVDDSVTVLSFTDSQ